MKSILFLSFALSFSLTFSQEVNVIEIGIRQVKPGLEEEHLEKSKAALEFARNNVDEILVNGFRVRTFFTTILTSRTVTISAKRLQMARRHFMLESICSNPWLII